MVNKPSKSGGCPVPFSPGWVSFYENNRKGLRGIAGINRGGFPPSGRFPDTKIVGLVTKKRSSEDYSSRASP